MTQENSQQVLAVSDTSGFRAGGTSDLQAGGPSGLRAGGYSGRILRVDLTRLAVEVETLQESFYRKYVGGSALGLYYLLRECPAQADPLGPENVLVLAIGPTAGAPFAGNSRLAVTAKSPLTGLAGDSQVGGYVGAELRFAGWDAVVVKGRAERPVYLWISDGKVEIRDAGHLWGRGTVETEEVVRQELGEPRACFLAIGPAGEKLARIAAIIHHGSRAAGRNGLGAVMGSKNLKAVAVRGTGRPAFAAPEALRAVARRGVAGARTDPGMLDLTAHGSAGLVEPTNASGALPTRNFGEGWFAGAEKISGPTTTATILKDRETCYGCPVRCKRVVEVKEGPFPVDPRYGGAEYESVAALGSYCGVDDLAAVQHCNQLCNHYGLDTISTGATIAFAMECFENGLLTKESTGGIELRFGRADALVEMIHRVGRREGLGNTLAEGSVRAAEVIGPESRRFLIASKGQELPAHMPQFKKSLAVVYAVNPFGADHESSEHDPSYEEGASPLHLGRLGQLGLHDPPKAGSLGPEKVRLAVYTQWFFSLLDTVPLCHFCFSPWSLYDPNDVAEVVRAATGWDTNLLELMQVGERRVVMMRAFNAREGATRVGDTLPDKCFRPLGGSGPLAGASVNREEWREAVDLYYRMMGWDPVAGNPTQATFDRLGIGWVGELSR